MGDAKRLNAPDNIDQRVRMLGYDIVAPIPSCVLMFKQELPLMFPDDADVRTVQSRIFDPFEYLMLRHRAGLLKTDFKQSLGKAISQSASVRNCGTHSAARSVAAR